MDDATKKLVMGIAAGALRKLALVAAGALTTHGIAVTGSFTETFVSAGLGLGVWAYSTYGDAVRVIMSAKFEVWKAKALAQAAALHANGIPPVTAEQIADHGPAELTAEKVVKVAATLCLLLAFGLIAGPALAQTQSKRFVPTGNLKADIAAGIGNKVTDDSSAALNSAFSALAKPFQDIAKFIGDDADGAVSLATAVPEIQDGHGQQCWMAMASFGRIVKAHPVPLTLRVMTDLEALRLLGIAANRLCANVHCTQVFADQTAMIQAASPIPLILPSLHDLCTKVPQIAVIDALTVPPPAPVTPAPITPVTPQ